MVPSWKTRPVRKSIATLALGIRLIIQENGLFMPIGEEISSRSKLGAVDVRPRISSYCAFLLTIVLLEKKCIHRNKVVLKLIITACFVLGAAYECFTG